MQNPCLSYFVHVDSAGAPVPGTMFGTTKPHGQATCGRLIAAVPPYQVAVTKECRPESGLRFFYRINSRTKAIVPNSMIAVAKKPKSLCSGIETLLEFIVTSPS